MTDGQILEMVGSWQRSAECVSHPVEDTLVILDIQSGEYVALNETAAAVWECLEQPADLDAIVNSLVTGYEVEPAVCQQAVQGVLATLSDKGLIRLVS